MTDKDSSDLDFVLEDPSTADAAVTTSEEDSGIPETINAPEAPEATTEVDEDIPVARPKVTRKKTATKADPDQTRSRKTKTKKPAQTTQTVDEAEKQPEDGSPTPTVTEDSSKPPGEAPASPQPPEAPLQQVADEPPPAQPASRPVQPPVQIGGAPIGEANGPERTDLVAPKEPVLLGSGPLPQDMVHRWDEMLSTVSANTRNAIWEQGLQSMEELLRTARKDLVKPLGQLGAEQCVELEAWLGRHGYKLPTEPQIKPFSGFGRRPGSSVAVDVKTGAEVNNTAAREKRVKEMKAMRTGG